MLTIFFVISKLRLNTPIYFHQDISIGKYEEINYNDRTPKLGGSIEP